MIKKIHYKDTYDIRHQVMWPDKPLDYIKLDQDPSGDHYGYFIEGLLVSVISVFKTEEGYQFRKFATLVNYQGQGIGRKLLNHIMTGYDNLWCNARIEKTGFYESFGMHQTDKTFRRGKKEYVIMKK